MEKHVKGVVSDVTPEYVTLKTSDRDAMTLRIVKGSELPAGGLVEGDYIEASYVVAPSGALEIGHVTYTGEVKGVADASTMTTTTKTTTRKTVVADNDEDAEVRTTKRAYTNAVPADTTTGVVSSDAIYARGEVQSVTPNYVNLKGREGDVHKLRIVKGSDMPEGGIVPGDYIEAWYVPVPKSDNYVIERVTVTGETKGVVASNEPTTEGGEARIVSVETRTPETTTVTETTTTTASTAPMTATESDRDSGLVCAGKVTDLGNDHIVVSKNGYDRKFDINAESALPDTLSEGDDVTVWYWDDENGEFVDRVALLNSEDELEPAPSAEVTTSASVAPADEDLDTEVVAEADTTSDLDEGETMTTTTSTRTRLPQTGTNLPLIGLLGLLGVAGGAALRIFR